MKTSQAGLEFITQNEGCVLSTYNDQAGYPTIGVGHLIKDGENIPDQITHAYAMQLLSQDVLTAEDAVNGLGWSLTQNQFDALVDFTFNAGVGALRQLAAHGQDDIPNQLPRWTHAGGVVLGALVKRRNDEIALWYS